MFAFIRHIVPFFAGVANYCSPGLASPKRE